MQNEPSNKLTILFFISDEKGRILSADNLFRMLMSVVYCFSFFAIHLLRLTTSNVGSHQGSYY